MSRSRCWLCVPPLALCVVDGAFTLLGQPAAYWAGEFAARNELNPLFDLLLAYNPFAFIAGWALWALGFGLAIILVSDSWALRMSYLLAFAHALGGAAWLAHAGFFGWPLAAGLFAAAQRLFWYACLPSMRAEAA